MKICIWNFHDFTVSNNSNDITAHVHLTLIESELFQEKLLEAKNARNVPILYDWLIFRISIHYRIGKATVVESAGIIHESIQMERNAGIGSFDGDDNAIKPGRKECIEGTRPISTSPSPSIQPSTFHERNLSKSSNLSLFLPPSLSPPSRLPHVTLQNSFYRDREDESIFLGNPINERREDCNRRRDAINGCRCGEGVDTCFVTSKGDACVTHACVIRQVSVPRCSPTCIGAGRHVLTHSIIVIRIIFPTP